jgi:hypothetical protein
VHRAPTLLPGLHTHTTVQFPGAKRISFPAKISRFTFSDTPHKTNDTHGHAAFQFSSDLECADAHASIQLLILLHHNDTKLKSQYRVTLYNKNSRNKDFFESVPAEDAFVAHRPHRQILKSQRPSTFTM